MSKGDFISRLIGGLIIIGVIWSTAHWMSNAKGQMTAEDAVAAMGIEAVHEQLLQQSDHTSKLAKYCKGKLRVADKSFKLLREDGWTLDQAIADLQESRQELKKEKGVVIEQYKYLEYERMTRTINRHPDVPTETLRKRFYGECLTMGF